ncbi:DNA-3-methyladenine glycosylase family protein [Granulicella paludicola]|uniref:DNA-3-methyladenine glycosylase family protein n=1 Tax=Granulicella paludicola TaxID=474951 RepID=UPI0021E088E8|nr:AlkA N-terminal domain-containing protein [Granulicella paludicola]
MIAPPPALSTLLPYTPPYDWQACLTFFRHHSMPGLETVDESGYERVVETAKGLGWFRVDHRTEGNCLRLSLWNGTEAELLAITVRARKMFDLDADPAALDRHMNANGALSEIWQRYPGLRLTRAWNGFEAVFATVLGQLVSVKFGRILTKELMTAAGRLAAHPRTGITVNLFPSATEILSSDLLEVRTSAKRRSTLHALASAINHGDLSLEATQDSIGLKRSLRNIAGVGAWTAEYAALRGFDDDDAFPATDYVLKRELKNHAALNLEAVRPLRGYAAIALWRHHAQREQP